MTGNGLKIRPNSSAVRSLPTTTGRILVEPQLWQRWWMSIRPHHRQVGGAGSSGLSDGGIPSGPLHQRQRAGAPQERHDSVGTYPLRGTWTRIGSSSRSAAFARRKAMAGRRPLLTSSGSSEVSVEAIISGMDSARASVRATRLCAQPEETSSCTSAVRLYDAKMRAHPSCALRVTNTSRECT